MARKIKRQALMGNYVSDSSDKLKEKSGDQKTLCRLAQNREAARKSQLRKKAYVQQLESSRLKLTQLEQELQQAHQQVYWFGAQVTSWKNEHGEELLFLNSKFLGRSVHSKGLACALSSSTYC